MGETSKRTGGATFAEIGEALGITEARAHAIFWRAIRKMRRVVTAESHDLLAERERLGEQRRTWDESWGEIFEEP